MKVLLVWIFTLIGVIFFIAGCAASVICAIIGSCLVCFTIAHASASANC